MPNSSTNEHRRQRWKTKLMLLVREFIYYSNSLAAGFASSNNRCRICKRAGNTYEEALLIQGCQDKLLNFFARSESFKIEQWRFWPLLKGIWGSQRKIWEIWKCRRWSWPRKFFFSPKLCFSPRRVEFAIKSSSILLKITICPTLFTSFTFPEKNESAVRLLTHEWTISVWPPIDNPLPASEIDLFSLHFVRFDRLWRHFESSLC